MYGFAIVGCGMIAGFHARAIDSIPDAELRAVVSRSRSSAQKLADEWGVEVVEDFQELLKRDDIDVVSFTVPSGAKMEMAVEAAEAGKHLVLEKPIEVTLERADKIISAVRRSGVKATVIFQSRFADVYRELKRALDNGALGKLIEGDCYVKWYRPQEYYSSSDWKGTWKYDGGGALINQSIHGVDLLRWLMGPADQVFAYAGCLNHTGIEVEDTAAAVVKFRNGAFGVIQGATSFYPGFAKRLELHGTKGTAFIEEDRLKFWETMDNSEPPVPISASSKGGASDPAAISFEGHARQIEDLCRSIKEDREPLINGEEGRKALELVLAIYQSARESRPVSLPLGST